MSGTVPAYNDNFHNGEKSISGDTDSIPPIGFQGLEIPKKQTELKIEFELCRWQVVGLFVSLLGLSPTWWSPPPPSWKLDHPIDQRAEECATSVPHL